MGRFGLAELLKGAGETLKSSALNEEFQLDLPIGRHHRGAFANSAPLNSSEADWHAFCGAWRAADGAGELI